LWRLVCGDPSSTSVRSRLRYIRRFATKEIARLLETPLGTILARLHRGRRLFEREMWAYAEEAGLLTTAR
jgi:hypothetical protein